MDAYSGELNFIFGEALLGGRVAAIYLARLKPEFYNLAPNELVFYDRVAKEAVHEEAIKAFQAGERELA